MFATDSKLPVPDPTAKREQVRDMFTRIAPKYDLLNHLLSLNIDRWWRREAVRTLGWETTPRGEYLDLCAGTLDLAATLANAPGFQGRVVGADFVLPMLQRGQGKSDRVQPLNADALLLPFRDAVFHGATISFGIRNVADLDAGLREAARILKPAARLVILEFTIPRWQPLRSLYLFYFRRVLPLIGRLLSKHTTAYDYLPASVLAFPEPDELAERMCNAGFTDVRYVRKTGGICAIHVGTRVTPGARDGT